MFQAKPRSLPNSLKILISSLALVFFISCKTSDTRYLLPTIVKKYPKNKPYVYKTNIKVLGNLSKTDKANLSSRLVGQLEDSVNPKASQKILWQVIKKPPVYDTFYVNKSKRFMDALLYSLGYFHHSITYDTVMN